MTRVYLGNKDGAAKGKLAGTEAFMDHLEYLYKFSNLGTWVVREMRGRPGQLSVHASARALDAGYTKKQRDLAVKICEFMTTGKNSEILGLQAIHDYAFTGPSGQWGRGWQNDRNAWKTYDAKSNAGTPGGLWLHFELDPSHAKDAKKVAAAFKAVLGG